MERPSATKWFRLRVACAVGVLAGLACSSSASSSPVRSTCGTFEAGERQHLGRPLSDPKRVGDPLQHEWGTPGPTCNRPLGLEPSGSAEPSLGRS